MTRSEFRIITKKHYSQIKQKLEHAIRLSHFLFFGKKLLHFYAGDVIEYVVTFMFMSKIHF